MRLPPHSTASSAGFSFVACSVIPVIYDRATKQIKRWYKLDFESQLADPAFQPADASEAMLKIPSGTYDILPEFTNGLPALDVLQAYINVNAP
jgi:hypothetical protein